jgi:hypothetical protein
MKPFRPYFLGLAGTGLVLCLLWQATSLLGVHRLDAVSLPLLVGLFVVQAFNVVQLLPFGPVVRESPTAGWRLALEGAPKWVKWLVPITGGYALCAFFLALPHAVGGALTDPHWIGLVLSSVFMPFYGAALAYTWAASTRDDAGGTWVCANGHQLDEPALHCPRCKADVHASLKQPGA